MAAELIALDSSKQSAFTKAVKNIKKSIAAKQEKEDEEKKYVRGIILVEHLPYGFVEEGLTGFFSQFGKVLRTRLARSKKTGRPKGYAFVEFEFEEVARIAAEAMNNYLMFERLIKCKLLPTPSIKDCKKIFAGAFIREDNYPKLIRQKEMKERLAKPMNEEEKIKHRDSRLNKIAQHNAKLAELGINYQFKFGKKEKKAVVQKPAKSPAKVESPVVKKRKSPAKVESPVVKKLKSPAKVESPVQKLKSSKKVETPVVQEKRKTPDKKSKFSPRVLRSRARPSVSAHEVINTPEKKELAQQTKSPAKQAREEHPTFIEKAKPKFSPKLLRSRARKSEGFSKPPSPAANAARKNYRKSIK